jgi:hypothetical protein
METLILASYVLKANQARDGQDRFPETEAQSYVGAWRTLASLAASAVGFGIFIAVISVL